MLPLMHYDSDCAFVSGHQNCKNWLATEKYKCIYLSFNTIIQLEGAWIIMQD